MRNIQVNLSSNTQNITTTAASQTQDINVNLKPLIRNIAVIATPRLQDIEVEMGSSNILRTFFPSVKIQRLPTGNFLLTIRDKNGTTTAEIPYLNEEHISSIVDNYLHSRSVITDFLYQYNNEQESRELIQSLILEVVSTLQTELNSLTSLMTQITREKLSFRIDTKANWDNQPTLISEAGVIYFYTDYQTKTLQNNVIQNIPGMKLGDGAAYLIDLPFMGGNTSEFEQHINNHVIHITQQERQTWNSKLFCAANNENLIFYTDNN